MMVQIVVETNKKYSTVLENVALDILRFPADEHQPQKGSKLNGLHHIELPNAFLVILHPSLVLMFIYYRYKAFVDRGEPIVWILYLIILLLMMLCNSIDITLHGGIKYFFLYYVKFTPHQKDLTLR
jgi:hypothetical protein